MSKNSEEAAKKTEEVPKNPEEPLKQLAPTEKTNKKAEAAETTPEPKGRGRPKGSKDAKPRIKRIPVAPPEEVEGEAAAAKPKPEKKTARGREEPEEQEPEQTREEPEAVVLDSLPEEPVVQMKSPRSQRRERMQALAAERLASTQARQARYDRVLDGFLGY